MTDEEFDVSDVKQVKAKKTKNELRLEREAEELRVLLGTYGGRAFIWRLLEKCRIFHSVPVIEPIQLAASVALSNFGKDLMMEVVKLAPNAYALMAQEADDREKGRKI